MANPQWTIVLNNGAYTFPVTTRRTTRHRQEFKENGQTDYRESLIAVEGVLLPDPGTPNDQVAANVTQKWADLRTICFNTAPVIVDLQLNGVSKEKFDPALGLGSPKCRELVELNEGAVEVTSVRFNITFWMKTPTRTSPDNQITGLKREVEELYDANGLLQQKTWSASATGVTLAAAKARVIAVKPTIKPLAEQYLENVDTQEFSAKWTWRVGIDDSIRLYQESISFKPGGFPVIDRPRIGDFAVFHQGRFRMGQLVITTTIEGTDPAKIVEPSQHVPDGVDVQRDHDRETGAEPMHLTLRAEGVYRAVFQEFYKVNDFAIPTLDHSDHGTPFKHGAIPNGNIGGSQGGLNK